MEQLFRQHDVARFVAVLGGRGAPGWGRVIRVWYAQFLAAYPDVVPKWKHHAAVTHLCAQLAHGFPRASRPKGNTKSIYKVDKKGDCHPCDYQKLGASFTRLSETS